MHELFAQSIDYDPTAPELPKLPSGGGVYLLTDERDQIVQLASAADLRRAVHHRLRPATTTEPPAADTASDSSSPTAEATAGTKPVASRRADLSQIVRRIWWQPVHSVFEATFAYHRIARVLLPGTYLKNIAFGPAWFVHVDPTAAVPRFWVSKHIQPAPAVTLGPVATQQDANRFVQVLEDVFDLCRYINILEQAPHGAPCAYYEMGRCPAPCGGLIPMSQYRETIAAALHYATGQRDAARNTLEQQMRDAAGQLAFEKAAAIKQRLERAKELEHPAYRLVRPIDQFSWVIVQRAGGRTRIKPFFVRGGWVEPGPAVKMKELDEAVAAWRLSLQQTPDTASAPPQLRSEQVWLVSHFLWRLGSRNTAPKTPPNIAAPSVGLFIDATQLPGDADLVEAIRQQFAPAKPAAPSPPELGAGPTLA